MPSAPRGGVGSSSHPPTGSRDHGTEEDDDEDDDDDDEVFIGRDLAHAKAHSEMISGEIDKEVKQIIDSCYARATELIRENMEVLHACANLLLKKEKISRTEFEALFEEEKPFFENI